MLDVRNMKIKSARLNICANNPCDESCKHDNNSFIIVSKVINTDFYPRLKIYCAQLFVSNGFLKIGTFDCFPHMVDRFNVRDVVLARNALF